MTVCPVCFYPTKYLPAVFGVPKHLCTNEECGWSGTIAIEVSKEDYENFLEERKKEKLENHDYE